MTNSLPLLVGVTGTNGKTSVTTMLAALLTSLGVPSAAIGQRIETPKGIYSRDDVPSGEYGLLQY
ncbi:MAG: Mur ligase family protein, partial [Glaciecola sp.]